MKKIILSVFLIAGTLLVQAQGKFSYAAQKNLMPKELGKVYLGMPFHLLAKEIDFSAAVAEARFAPLSLTIPYAKGPIKEVTVKIHGLTEEEKKAMLVERTVTTKESWGDNTRTETGIDVKKIPQNGFVYVYYVTFKDDFDIDTYTNKLLGKPSSVHTEGDYYIYDKQWTKKTSDGLTWLIRGFTKETKVLQLIGIIKKTEWDPEA